MSRRHLALALVAVIATGGLTACASTEGGDAQGTATATTAYEPPSSLSPAATRTISDGLGRLAAQLASAAQSPAAPGSTRRCGAAARS